MAQTIHRENNWQINKFKIFKIIVSRSLSDGAKKIMEAHLNTSL